MLVLAVDTSGIMGSLAVVKDGEILGIVSTSSDEAYSSRMFRHLEFLLRELSLDLGDIDLFAVAAGPGSFTGLRVGLAAVKGWAEVYGKPIAAVSGLEAVATQSHSQSSLVVPVLDAHRGQIYFGMYRRMGEPNETRLALEGEECVMTPEEFLESLHVRGAADDCTIVTPTPALISGAT